MSDTNEGDQRGADQDRYYEEFLSLVFADGQRATLTEVLAAVGALDLPSHIDGSRAELERQIERLVALGVLDVQPGQGAERFTLGKARRALPLNRGQGEQEE